MMKEIFTTGIAPNLQARDDLTRDFGDPQEESLKAILDYISTGSVQRQINAKRYGKDQDHRTRQGCQTISESLLSEG